MLLGACLYLGAALEQQCNELMRTKFGRLVDLEALQMLSGNRRLEELKQEKLLKEAAYAKEIKQWDVCLPVCVCVWVREVSKSVLCFHHLQSEHFKTTSG